MRSILGLLALMVAMAVPAQAGGHTWRVKEIFSNADGTIQYVEVWEALGGAGEVATAGHDVSSNTNAFTIPSNVATPTSLRSILLATQGFADLNVVTPDYIIPDNFFSLTADSITYVPFHTVTFSAGQLPTDGVNALLADLTTDVNSPQNYAGEMGSVNLAAGPPAVPRVGSQPLVVAKVDPSGGQLRLQFDTQTCDGNTDHQVIHGFGSELPTSTGAAFSIQSSECSIGGSPFDWALVPDPASDGSRLLWFLVQATDGNSVEGSLGSDSASVERQGPAAGGASGQCANTEKSISNTCGQ